jgi:HK97 family phage major capsid protein
MFVAVLAGLQTAAWYALGPVHDWYMNRSGYVLRDAPGEIKALEKTVVDKFNELRENIKKNQDAMDKAVDEAKRYGDTIEAKTADKLKELGEKSATLQTELKNALDAFGVRILEVEQKQSQRPSPEQKTAKSSGEVIIESDAYKAMVKSKGYNSSPIELERKTVFNASVLDGNQPLVIADRKPGIIMPVNRRLTIRDLLPQIPTQSDLVQYAKELVFTNNAGPQGGLTSPTVAGGEGEIKPESQITFQLASAAVITLAHFLGASRQVMSDAQQLAGYINSRLNYGLKLEEETELLTGDGTSGKLNGVNNQASAFSYTTSGTQGLDVLLYAFLQVSLTNMEASGVILHPIDWTVILKLKDTQGRYLFANPHDANQPQVWGKPVVPTQTQKLGKFTTGAFDMGAAIYDRENVTVRMSDQHADFFTRNLVAILCEERLALAVYRPEAFVYGDISAF